MNKFFVILALALFSLTSFAEDQATVYVTLSPAGSFNAVSKKVKANLFKQGETFTAEKITVTVESFKTGIDLRDEHFWKHLQAAKYPKVTLTDLKATGGKATANLEVAGVTKLVNITYVTKGTDIVATFNVKASDFKLPKAEYLGVGVDDNVKVETTIGYRTK